MKTLARLLAVALLIVGSSMGVAGLAFAAGATPVFTISPNPLHAGDEVTFSGTGCIARSATDPTPEVLLSLDGDIAPAITPAPDGTWSMSSTTSSDMPDAEFTFNAVCDGYNWSFDYAPVTLTVRGGEQVGPVLFLPAFLLEWDSTPMLRAGVPYDVIGSGFGPNETVQVVLHSDPLVIATLTTDDDGITVGSFTIPVATEPGAHTLALHGTQSDRTASVNIGVVSAKLPTPVTTITTATQTVTQTPAASATVGSATVISTETTTVSDTAVVPTSQQLAATGAAPEGSVGVAFALILAGGAITMFSAGRRRPRSGSRH